MSRSIHHISIIGNDEKHRCHRCRRDLPWDQFPPIYRKCRGRQGVHILLLRHPRHLALLQGRLMQDPNAMLSPVRPFVAFLGTVLITMAAVKWLGAVPQIRTEFWQLAILGFALKSW
jgi:hypothetical protein